MESKRHKQLMKKVMLSYIDKGLYPVPHHKIDNSIVDIMVVNHKLLPVKIIECIVTQHISDAFRKLESITILPPVEKEIAAIHRSHGSNGDKIICNVILKGIEYTEWKIDEV